MQQQFQAFEPNHSTKPRFVVGMSINRTCATPDAEPNTPRMSDEELNTLLGLKKKLGGFIDSRHNTENFRMMSTRAGLNALKLFTQLQAKPLYVNRAYFDALTNEQSA